jgi:hypothetical protein
LEGRKKFEEKIEAEAREEEMSLEIEESEEEAVQDRGEV